MNENKSSISRRKFVRNTAIGTGLIGAGIASAAGPGNLNNSYPSEGICSPREILVQTVSNQKFDIKRDNVKFILDRLESTSSYKPDIICIPEAFANTSKSGAEPLSGPIINAFSNYAGKHNCYIICTLYTKRNGRIYNTAVLLDRKGQIAGMYDKIRPTEGECDNGVTPGELKPPVFKTDFGTIGVQICFDINWPEQWKMLKDQGAEIIFWPSAYPQRTMLATYASLYKYYVVGCSRIDPCYVYDMTGELLAKSGRYEGWAFAYLNLEKIFCEIDFHVEKIREIRKKYGRKVEVNYFHDNDWVTIESRSPDLFIQQIVDEFGLISHPDYIKRAEKYMDKFRK
ncbi:carbon-nitrogen hydrolase family protein [candidate division KSB1 bacterium]|nr:carbon-nitrogen hydrolase family protein [candidate division KSB1 bacterium]